MAAAPMEHADMDISSRRDIPCSDIIARIFEEMEEVIGLIRRRNPPASTGPAAPLMEAPPAALPADPDPGPAAEAA